MFHWICPECGLEIAPTAKECPSCDPSPVAAAAPETAPVDVAAPEPPAALPEALAAATEAPEAVIEAPIAETADTAPFPEPAAPQTVLSSPEPTPSLPPLAAAEPFLQSPGIVQLPQSSSLTLPAPPLGLAIPCSPVRRTPWQTLTGAAHGAPALSLTPLPSPVDTRIPHLSASFSPGPSWTIPGRLPDAALSKLQAKRGGLQPACADPVSQSSLPGPTLPYELTSLEAAGLSKMVWFSPVRESAPRKAGMFVSAAVASGFLAAAIAGVFYAMPTMARTQAPSTQQVPVAEATPTPAPVSRPAPAELEVTGVRFITDVPDQRPQIHYLVVNHTNTVLNGTLVNVTLRASGSDTPLSQFSFRTPRLGPYEYKEMVSTIERLNRPLELPDWRDVLAETELVR